VWVRVLHFSDLHGDTRRAQRILRYAQEYDVDALCGTGDFERWSGGGDKEVLQLLASLEKPVLIVWGNCDRRCTTYGLPNIVEVGSSGIELQGIRFASRPVENGVWLTRVPPAVGWDALTLLFGSFRLRKQLRQSAPRAVLSGHIHFAPRARVVQFRGRKLLWARAGIRTAFLLNLRTLQARSLPL